MARRYVPIWLEVFFWYSVCCMSRIAVGVHACTVVLAYMPCVDVMVRGLVLLVCVSIVRVLLSSVCI